MNDDSIAVQESPPKPKRRQKKRPADSEPKKQPPYAVVVFNDDEHSFQYVVETFTKVFGYSWAKGFSLALAIHIHGKGIVWSGSLEVAELKRDQIRSAGPDFYASQKVDFPLGVTIEPLPG